MSENLKSAPGAAPRRLIYSEWEVNLGRFVALRAVTFLGLLAVLLFLFIMGADSAELSFHFILILAWFVGSFLIEAFVVAVGRTLRLRCGLFAMADMYLMLSLFSQAGGAMLPAVSAFAGYTLLAAVSCGLSVGALSAAIGLVVFVQGYIVNADVSSETLIFTAFTAIAALSCACLWKCGSLRLSSQPGVGEKVRGGSPSGVSKSSQEMADLQATLAAMQDQLVKITKERDDVLLRLDKQEPDDDVAKLASALPSEEQFVQTEQPSEGDDEPSAAVKPDDQEKPGIPVAPEEKVVEDKPPKPEQPIEAAEPPAPGAAPEQAEQETPEHGTPAKESALEHG